MLPLGLVIRRKARIAGALVKMTCTNAGRAGDVSRRWKKSAAVLVASLATIVLGLTPAGARASTVPSEPPITWSAPAWLAGVHQVDSLSCPSASLCVAVDDDGQVLTSTDPAGGASAWDVADIDGTDAIASVSCPSLSLCVAVDAAGHVLTSTEPAGGASEWKTAEPAGPTQLNSVSCPSTALCVVGGLGLVLTSTDPAGGASTWQESATASSPDWFDSNSLSCPSTTLCVAADMTADGTSILTSTDPAAGGQTWTSVLLPDISWVFSMSCPTTSLCVTDGSDSAVSASSQVILSSTDPAGGGTTWKVTPVTNSGWSGGLGCASASLCVAFGADGTYYSTSPAGGASAWKYAAVQWSLATAVACPSAWLCVAGVSNLPSKAAGIETGIVPRPTRTALSLSAEKVRYGSEHSEHLSVTVQSASGGLPAGIVKVTSGTLTVCTMRLARGKASCALSSRKLRRGSHRLRAVYEGNSYFRGSTSRTARLIILSPPH
jgi:hypothetical protein